MPSPKSGKAGTPVSPPDPAEAKEADEAGSGALTTAKAEAAKGKKSSDGTSNIKPFKKPSTDEEKKKKTSWIEIKLVDVEDNPVPGEPFEIELPDSSVYSGTLDEKGFARVEGFEPGSCKVTFPQRAGQAWKKK